MKNHTGSGTRHPRTLGSFLTEIRHRLRLTPEDFWGWLKVGHETWPSIEANGVPPDLIATVADRLPLDEADKQHFLRLAWLDHAPLTIRHYVNELETQIEQLTARHEEPDLDLINSLLAEEGERQRSESFHDLASLVEAAMNPLPMSQP